MAVSAVLNGARTSSRVSEDTRNRILAAAQKLRYRPNATARGLAGRRMNTLGVAAILGGAEPNQYFLEVFSGIINGGAAAGQTITVFTLDTWEQAPQRTPASATGPPTGRVPPPPC